jgi:hypothetical protein
MLVVSLVGVILIARPPFLFGDGGFPEDAPEAIDPLVITTISEGSSAERMIAVWYAAMLSESIEVHVTLVLPWAASPVPLAHVRPRNISPTHSSEMCPR